ncbi:MAG: hypothetical protein V8T87_07205 [Victivallales bacterium]
MLCLIRGIRTMEEKQNGASAYPRRRKSDKPMYFLNLKNICGEIKYAWGLADSRWSFTAPESGACFYEPADNSKHFAARHNRRCNMWFFDGHAASQEPKKVSEVYQFVSGLATRIYMGNSGGWQKF